MTCDLAERLQACLGFAAGRVAQGKPGALDLFVRFEREIAKLESADDAIARARRIAETAMPATPLLRKRPAGGQRNLNATVEQSSAGFGDVG